MANLNYDTLRSALSPGFAALRLRQRLLPAGGPGAKVFPPTFEGGHYCWERRRISPEASAVDCVLLASVADQANRQEEALEQHVQDGLVKLPLLRVGFKDFPEIGDVSTLRAPHRVFDAILRDSQLNGTPFFQSDTYKSLARASIRDATALFAHCPTALVYGAWDSTGSAGGLGNKFARALTTEIVGFNAEWGHTRGGVRFDPLGASSRVKISKPKDKNKVHEWQIVGIVTDADKTLAEEQSPSSVNHSNILITPKASTERSIRVGDNLFRERVPVGGGVTIDHAMQTVVLSLAQLRRLRFPLEGRNAPERDMAARACLTALGLLGIATTREYGYALRSRCDLVCDGFAPLELVASNGETTDFELDAESALKMFNESVDAARSAGLPWEDKPIELEPLPKLVDLVRKSRLAERGSE
jgi:CRISPR-associated protein Csb1